MREKRTIFLSFKLGFFGEMEKKEAILDWERGRILDPGDRDKRPCSDSQNTTKVVCFQISKLAASKEDK